jgi:hypothetical protein
MSNSSLDFFTTKELFTEIARRYDAFLFVGYKDRDERHYSMTYETKGTAPEIVGLGVIVKDHVMDLITGNEQE